LPTVADDAHSQQAFFGVPDGAEVIYIGYRASLLCRPSALLTCVAAAGLLQGLESAAIEQHVRTWITASRVTKYRAVLHTPPPRSPDEAQRMAELLRWENGRYLIVHGRLPHQWLFQRVQAVVVPATPGIIYAALRYGVPVVPVTATPEHAWYARRIAVQNLGAPALALDEVTDGRLLARLQTATSDPAVAGGVFRAKSILSKESGARDAALCVQQFVNSRRVERAAAATAQRHAEEAIRAAVPVSRVVHVDPRVTPPRPPGPVPVPAGATPAVGPEAGALDDTQSPLTRNRSLTPPSMLAAAAASAAASRLVSKTSVSALTPPATVSPSAVPKETHAGPTPTPPGSEPARSRTSVTPPKALTPVAAVAAPSDVAVLLPSDSLPSKQASLAVALPAPAPAAAAAPADDTAPAGRAAFGSSSSGLSRGRAPSVPGRRSKRLSSQAEALSLARSQAVVRAGELRGAT
jgi:hypothetical protein